MKRSKHRKSLTMLSWPSKKSPKTPTGLRGKKKREKKKQKAKAIPNGIIQDKIQILKGVYYFEQAFSVYHLAMR